ncbi:uncharacterized protein BT62DRAFT_1041767, partial [Guyanagaster necrorhizus]
QIREFDNHRHVSCHPNIVTFHKAIFHDEFFYVVLDLCEGGDLFDRILQKSFYPRDDRCETSFSSLSTPSCSVTTTVCTIVISSRRILFVQRMVHGFTSLTLVCRHRTRPRLSMSARAWSA